MAWLVSFGLWELYFFVFIGIPLNVLCIALSFLKENSHWQQVSIYTCVVINVSTLLVLLLWARLSGSKTSPELYDVLTMLIIALVTGFYLFRQRQKNAASA